MRATADTIWQVPAYLPYLQPPLTDAAVAAAERQIGNKLPAEYLELLRKQNGGYIRLSLPEMVHDVIAGIGPHFPSLTGYELADCQEYVSYSLKGLVPFDGDGHWYLCLDYRKNPDSPAVSHIDIELDLEGEVARSFADYLAMLRIDVEDEENEFVLEAVADVEAVKAALATSLGVTFDATDTWAHGYAIHRAKMGTDSDPQWLWLTPNLVPRGFARPDEARYAELKDLMPGNAPRFPELPIESHLLSATEGVQSKVLEACVKSGFLARPLREYLRRG